MKKTLIKLISLLLLASLLFSLSACGLQKTPVDGIMYVIFTSTKGEDCYSACGIGAGWRDQEVLYVPPQIKGIPVCSVSDRAFYFRSARFYSDALVRLYFPYTITSSCREDFIGFSTCADALYVIQPSVHFTFGVGRSHVTVIPYLAYEELRDTRYIQPANIAYFFNYENAPNEGYFFIDLFEEDRGTIAPPPYPPERNGYTFTGWFCDEECTIPWDFEKDEVTLLFDEEGYVVYEEIRLYAGWERDKIILTW